MKSSIGPVVFFGTSEFAAVVLRYLFSKQLEIVAVVTKPDQPQGRGLSLLEPPVKRVWRELGREIPILQPLKAFEADFLEQIRLFNPSFFVVVAYGHILKEALLKIPSIGAINIHASLLPRYRGAAPIQRAILNGESETGVAIMDMELTMDTGAVYRVARLPMTDQVDAGEVSLQLSHLSGPLLVEVLEDLSCGKGVKVPQEHSLATYAPKIAVEEEKICWENRAAQELCRIRAFSPKPGAWTYVIVKGVKRKLKIFKATVQKSSGAPGMNLVCTKKEWIIACGEGALQLEEVQLEGKKKMAIREFLQGMVEDLQVVMPK